MRKTYIVRLFSQNGIFTIPGGLDTKMPMTMFNGLQSTQTDNLICFVLQNSQRVIIIHLFIYDIRPRGPLKVTG